MGDGPGVGVALGLGVGVGVTLMHWLEELLLEDLVRMRIMILAPAAHGAEHVFHAAVNSTASISSD